MFYNASFSCDACGNGLMAFVMGGDQASVVLFCLNCGTWYTSIENGRVQREKGANLSNPNHPSIKEPIEENAKGEIVLISLGCSVSFPPARWATEKEIIAFGWGEYVDGVNAWLPEQASWWSRRIRGQP